MVKKANGRNNNEHKVRNGVLWILSPFIVFVITFIVTIAFRIAGLDSMIINVISLLAGIAGVLLMFIGPVIGIIKLTSK